MKTNKNTKKTSIATRWFIPAMVLLSALFIVFPMNAFPLVLMQSMGAQLLFGYVALSILAVLIKQIPTALSSLVSFIILLLFFYPYVKSGHYVESKHKGLTVAHYNVLKYNKKYKQTIDSALDVDADFLSFQEVDNGWAKSLKNELTAKYPYSFINPQEDCYGSAVFSKYPLSNVSLKQWGNHKHIVGSLNYKKQKIRFVTMHTVSPIRPYQLKVRNEQLKALASYIKSIEGPKLAIGDFNTVPWDSQIRRVQQQGALTDSRMHYAGTYPSIFPHLRIPIDYIMHSQEFSCSGFRTLKNTASDHHGIVGYYQLKGKGKSS